MFNEYVNTLYERKGNTSDLFMKNIKGLLNSLLGRLGINIIKDITSTV